MGPLVVSPHFDDAALSVGQTILSFRSVTAVTVFTGVPADPEQLTTYDERCGFTSAAHAVAARTLEDDMAMRTLGVARTERLGFVDSQYGQERDRDTLVSSLRNLVNRLDPSAVFAPVGALHPDHVFLTEAILDVTPDVVAPVWLWADLPNTVSEPRALDDALGRVTSRGFTVTETPMPAGPLERKRGAVRCYRSQLWALKNRFIYVPERVWRVA